MFSPNISSSVTLSSTVLAVIYSFDEAQDVILVFQKMVLHIPSTEDIHTFPIFTSRRASHDRLAFRTLPTKSGSSKHLNRTVYKQIATIHELIETASVWLIGSAGGVLKWILANAIRTMMRAIVVRAVVKILQSS